MLMVLADKRSKVYRDRMSNLQQFVESNSVPAVRTRLRRLVGRTGDGEAPSPST